MMDRIRISLAAARVNAGLSQKEAAKRLHTTTKTIQNHESGKTEPGWNMVERYANLYGLPIDAIFFGKNSALSGIQDAKS